MNAPQHTPGPWTWDTTLGSARLVQAGTNVPVLTAIPGVCEAIPTVAVNSQEWDGPPFQLREAMPQDANAALISAAPDMLAACEYVLDMLEQRIPTGNAGESVSVAERLAGIGGFRAHEMLRLAIARAKGGAV